jgi:hypothetical protein
MRLSKKSLVLIATSIAITYLPTIECSYAQDALEKKQKALNMIVDFAERYCLDVPLGGGTIKRELSAEGKVQLNKFLKAFFDLEVGAGGKYQISEYTGILQKDLADALETSSNCRVRVLELLKDELLIDEPIRAAKLPYVFIDEKGMLDTSDYNEKEIILWEVYPTGIQCIEDLSKIKRNREPRALHYSLKSPDRCTRLLPEVWCFTRDILMLGAKIECYLTQEDCHRQWSFWNLPARKNRSLTTPCEPHSSNEIVSRSTK